MNLFLTIVFFALLFFVLMAARTRFSGPMTVAATINTSPPPSPKPAVLASCGFQPAPPFTLADMYEDLEPYERDAFEPILLWLGGMETREPWRPHCINLWYFDAECFDGPGCYEYIAHRVMQMTEGSLLLENIKDDVDIYNETASLSFTFQGRDLRIDCKVNDDWADMSIFGNFVKLLAFADSSKVFIHYDLGEQNCLIGCVKKEALKRLQESGIPFTPLT